MAYSLSSTLTSRARGLAPALLALLAVAAPPQEADACSPDICYDIGRWHDIAAGNPQEVPTDGVFVLDGSRDYDGDASDTFAAISVDVSVDGMPVDGALESVGLTETMIWRPAAPLIAGATYLVTVAIDNAAIEPGFDGECGPDLLEVELSFAVGEGPASPLVAPDYDAVESYGVTDVVTLEGLVCCGGAYPLTEANCGWEDVSWSVGECAPTERVGHLSAGWSGGELASEHAGMVAYRLLIDGEASGSYRYGSPYGHTSQSPFCGNVELLSLADGSVASSPEVCFGDDLSDPLGPHAVDPLLELGACADGAYTCSIAPGDFGDAWDADDCQAWPGGDGTTGGETTEGETSGSDSAGSSTGEDTSGPDDTAGKTSSATAGEDDGPEGGCACAADPRGGASGLALVLLALGLRRRRG